MNVALELRLRFAATRDDGLRRPRGALKNLDRELAKGNFKRALSIVKQLRGKPGGLRGFGSAKLIPKKLLGLDEKNPNEIELSSLQPLADSIMSSIWRCDGLSLSTEMPNDEADTIYHDDNTSSYENYRYNFVQHEAGHFLVGYLLGVLPRFYTIPSLEALRHDEVVTGSVKFVGFEFLKDVGVATKLKKDALKDELYHQAHRDRIPSKTLNNFSCVVLGGLVAEHMLFGYSIGVQSDAYMLKTVLKWCGYTETEAKSQLRWATFNTISILQSHRNARRLAEAMSNGRSIGSCIDSIESAIF